MVLDVLDLPWSHTKILQPAPKICVAKGGHSNFNAYLSHHRLHNDITRDGGCPRKTSQPPFPSICNITFSHSDLKLPAFCLTTLQLTYVT